MAGRSTRRKPGASKARACLGKGGSFPTKQAAQEAAERFMEAHPWAGEKVGYLCHFKKKGIHYHFGAPLGRK